MYFKIVRVLLVSMIPLLITCNRVHAQGVGREILSLHIQEAEALFLKNNLSLLAGQYAIDNARVQIITAKLFDNPQFSIENILYNPESKKFFDMSYDGGQYGGSITQLFQTAGKRNKNIRLAKINVQEAEYNFFDLLRTLRYTLRSDFYKIYFQEQSAAVYTAEINSLSKTLSVFRQQYAKGNIAEKEVLRIQSQLYSLQAELNDLKDAIDDVQSEFKLLIRANPKSDVKPQISFNLDGKDVLEQVPYQKLLDSATANRYDLKAAHSALEYSNLNLKLQKAMAIPDVNLSLTYDKQGSFVRNYSGLGISIPIPLFNRNQGNIKQARIAVESSKVGLQQQQDQIESDLDNAYQGALRLELLYNSFDPKFKTDFNHLIEEVSKNYEKRNISLLEFLDFYDSYKTNTIQLNNLQLNRINSLEQLNFVTGTPIFNK
ncbi:TolC family protein [Pedobacter sp. HMWF019]|uniref:TolC family protein n=1 Tax=Pedobacter sp. HMWF019 TaxID=2056856 RepID=UPI000D3A657C|nr:TolC family protein [Pedobacter sp. HMWF019]PTT02273.1 TolC family protein [Pedobacter sp. HMWF019]